MTPSDDVLWWFMVSVAVTAAGLSVTTSVLDRRASRTPGRRARFLMHIVSYALMTVSVLIFVLRALLGPE
jgi:hypothetical protein